MQKKEIKRRRPNNKKPSTTRRSTSNTKNIKKRVTNVSSKEEKQAKLIFAIVFVAIVLLCYFTLGTFFALLTGVGIAIIIGVAKILEKCKDGKKARKTVKIILMIILGLGILLLCAFTAFLIYIKIDADPKYVTSKLETQENTTFLDMNNQEYAKLGSEMREKVKYEDLPEVLVDAIIATEDSRFFQHNGFDAPRFLKASIGQVIQKVFHRGSNAGGASTLTMQVVKNSLTNAYSTEGITGIVRKFEDIYLAIFKLEKNCSKEQIIEYYVNNHYLSGNVYGVQEAAETYFGKTVSELNLSEAATLAGMFKSPNYYNPEEHPDRAQERRKTVLYLMRRHGYITAEEEKIANSIPVSSLIATSSESTYNSEYSGYIDTVVDEIKEKYGVNPYTTPLVVYTNLDTSKQKAVNSVMNGESYTWINDKVQAGVAVLDTETGKILAIGNGRNIGDRSANKKGQWNYATKNKRQPGSTAKPLFDYGPGMEYNNWSTYTLFEDAPYSYSDGRKINNWDGKFFGTITLRRALSTSRNIPALKAFQQVDNKKILEFVSNLGISPEVCSTGYTYDTNTLKCVNKNGDTEEPTKVHEAHSIGAFSGTNPLQMSAAYAAFSNGGYYNEPYSVSKIVFKNTNETKEHNSDNYVIKRKAMSDSTAFMITSVLQDVNLNGGNPSNVARKTGTTNYDSKTMSDKNLPWDAIPDSWVIGYSTKTAIGLWYGYDFIDSEYCLHNVPASVQKDKIFNALINSGAMESNREAFKQPSSVVKVGVVQGSNPPKLAGNYSGSIVYEYFKKGFEPEDTYTEEKLAAPENFNVKYNKLTKKVTLNWKSVSTSGIDDKDYGTFGYNIYFNNTLIGFTEKTSFTYTPASSPYGTYKVMATYKSYSGIQSQSATYTLEEEKEDNLELEYTGSTVIPASGSLVFNLATDFIVKNNGSTVSATIESCTPSSILLPGDKLISCTVNYQNHRKVLSTTITATKESTE